MKPIAALALAAVAMTAAAAESPDKAAREVRSGWLVMPDRGAIGAAQVRRGAIVLRQQVVPIGYETLDGDALDAQGAAPLIPADAPMMRLIGGQGVVACVIGEPAHKALSSFWDGFTGGRSRLCLVDADKDGRFEAFVRYRGLVSGLPSVNGRLPKTPHPLSMPVAYTVHDPRTLPIGYFIGIRYDGHSITGNPVFSTVFGRDGDIGTLDLAWPRGEEGAGKVQPTGRVLLKGAVIDVQSDAGDTLSLTVEKTLPTGIFGINQTGSNGFY